MKQLYYAFKSRLETSVQTGHGSITKKMQQPLSPNFRAIVKIDLRKLKEGTNINDFSVENVDACEVLLDKGTVSANACVCANINVFFKKNKLFLLLPLWKSIGLMMNYHKLHYWR